MILKPPFEGNPKEIRGEIFQLEEQYFGRPVSYAANSKAADDMAQAAGERIRNGERTRENLKIIFRWKNDSSRFYASRLERQLRCRRCGARGKASLEMEFQPRD